MTHSPSMSPIQPSFLPSASTSQATIRAGSPFAFEDVTAEMVGRMLCVRNRNWQLCSSSRVYPGLEGESCSAGRCILSVNFRALYNVARDPVLPHGLVGQSLDADNSARDGTKDDYSADEITTHAQAEGAIQGIGQEYMMDSKFETNFKYTRFLESSVSARTATRPTNSSQMPGAATEVSI